LAPAHNRATFHKDQSVPDLRVRESAGFE
jgi:hypothetical protein